MSHDDWGLLIFSLTFFLAVLLRIFPGFITSFPINDGGMFYVMARDLRANGFLIPAFTTYNNYEIPFAYPPLGFYVKAVLNMLGISEIAIVHWLPICMSCISVIVFYFLANAILKDKPRAAVATLIFALTPGGYDMQIMGGGLTRSFGVFFFTLAVYAVYQLFQISSWKHVVLASLFCSLAVLSHPEIVVATATGCSLLWIFYGRTWRKTFHAILVAASTLVLTAPWWGSVMAQHGLAPFLSALNTGAYGGSPFIALYGDFLAPASLFTLFGLLRIVGIIWCLWKRQYFLIAWAVMPYFVEPRSASGIAATPSAMLMALCIADVLPVLFEWICKRLKRATIPRDFTQYPWLNMILLILMFYFFLVNALHDFSLANTTLKQPDVFILMDWVKRNTPPYSQFVILTGNTGVATDPIQEWFPAFTARRSQTTSQGLEWKLGTGFFTLINQLITLQRCGDIACVENWSTQTGLDYTDLIVEQNSATQSLIASLNRDTSYSAIYQNTRYLVYQK